MRTEKDGSIKVLADKFDGKRFNSPNDVAVRSDGTLWFTDPPWGLTGKAEIAGHYVFKLDPKTGKVEAVVTDLAMPNGIVFSPDESRLYIADTWNNRIRWIDLDPASPTYHLIYTFAGKGPARNGSGAGAAGVGGGYFGDGAQADSCKFKFPNDVKVGPDHSVYVCDSYNNVVRRIKPMAGRTSTPEQWIVSTVAGNNAKGPGFSGDGGLATDAQLYQPNGIWITNAGYLFIADTENQRIRRVKIAN